MTLDGCFQAHARTGGQSVTAKLPTGFLEESPLLDRAIARFPVGWICAVSSNTSLIGQVHRVLNALRMAWS